MSYLDKAKEMYKLIDSGRMMDAFEKFYHDDVVMIEATGEVREGKETNRKFEEEWLNNLQEMHDGGSLHITSNEEDAITMVESWIDVTFKDGSRVKMEEVAVQYWENDKIIKERFYYNAPN